MAEGVPARDPERTRNAVLDAAERLFAQKGFVTTTLRQIGEVAGVSRGTPSYFFDSKEGLYLAVKKRMAWQVRSFAEQAQRAGGDGGGKADPREVLAGALALYTDFLAANPNYVRLVEREASGEEDTILKGAAPSEARLAESLGTFGIEFLEQELQRGLFREVDARQLAASMIALCSFPFLLGGSLIRTLGIDPDDPAFLEERKRHVVELVMKGICERE